MATIMEMQIEGKFFPVLCPNFSYNLIKQMLPGHCKQFFNRDFSDKNYKQPGSA
jgi:hypothetical protein